MEHDSIQRHLVRVEQIRDLVQENGDVVRSPFIDSFPVSGSDKKRVMPEMSLHLRVGKGIFAKKEDMHKLNIFELILSPSQDIHQNIRCRRVPTDIDSVSAFDAGNGFFGGYKFLFIIVDPAHERFRFMLFFELRYLSISVAAIRASPMARMTVAPPRMISPPA